MAYVPGSPPQEPGPLSRFLPPLEVGTVAAWVAQNAAPGSWLLDPFGFSPRVSIEAARACYEAALDYAIERKQFGVPIGSFQLTQRKLVEMLVRVNKGTLLALHLGRMKDAGRLSSAQVSFGKMDNVREALWVAREARGVLGANGITLEYPVIRHMNNLESVYTYEGTNEIHTLIVGETLTGLRAYE